MRRIATALLLSWVALVATAACSDPLSVTDGVLRVNPQPPGLNIMNASAQPVHLFIADRNTLALLDWAPCAGPSCPSLPGGASVLRPCSEIVGCTADSREAVVYWWRSVPDGAGAFRPDSIRQLIARFK